MEVKIGPYVDWIGPYQIAQKILFWKNKDEHDVVYNLGKWLAKDKNGNSSLLNEFCQWLYNKKKRKIKVKIDDYDLWSVDSTLCHIIHPLLVKFVDNLQSTARVDKEDVPVELHSTYGEYTENDGGMSSMYSHEAWLHVLNEMIWSFDPEWDDKYGYGAEEFTHAKYDEHLKRQQKGFALFGKYFSAIWS